MSVEELRRSEVRELISYLKSEDPESCINILFVLSQCKSEHESASPEKAKDHNKAQLSSLMRRLNIKKSFLVECMHKVLYDNLLDFF